MAKVKKKEDELKAIIMGHMEAADTLTWGNDILATWKLGKPSKRLDTKALKSAHPDIYEEFAKEGKPSRRFLIK